MVGIICVFVSLNCPNECLEVNVSEKTVRCLNDRIPCNLLLVNFWKSDHFWQFWNAMGLEVLFDSISAVDCGLMNRRSQISCNKNIFLNQDKNNFRKNRKKWAAQSVQGWIALPCAKIIIIFTNFFTTNSQDLGIYPRSRTVTWLSIDHGLTLPLDFQ